MRWTADEPEDPAIRSVVSHFKGRLTAWKQVLELAHQQPQLFASNARFARNEGACWEKVKALVPSKT